MTNAAANTNNNNQSPAKGLHGVVSRVLEDTVNKNGTPVRRFDVTVNKGPGGINGTRTQMCRIMGKTIETAGELIKEGQRVNMYGNYVEWPTEQGKLRVYQAGKVADWPVKAAKAENQTSGETPKETTEEGVAA